ncbi:sugar ABC transporter permease [Neorhizobium sp. P12A]|uniref:carbohydrate ABC transporter permease n=1 Tax=Rhizobium/Agrobacterium group TaxID=227290 RepID=UPI001051AD46|nr:MULTISPECIES: sugar ABC transporter permease [Rhizobium/Agrobacterium group]KAA0697929.1 sugar ABC transporter permease [Neorhizobium sp. P12A]TCR87844.1 glucose/mannose transport system permease protein [Rhizobium sp. BK376]
MGIRWSRVTPHLAVAPAALLTLVFFIGSIGWTVYLSFTASRRFPDYELVGWKQYWRLFHDASWLLSLQNLVIFALGSLLSIVVGFILAALIDKEVHGEGIFRTVFLYPLAVSLIVTGLVWRWLFNPGLGVENVLHSIGWQSASFNWLASQDTVMFGVILAAVWQSTGFFMALMLSGLKSINSEIWQAARLDGVPFWRLYIEVIIPMMKLTFLTCIILLCIGVVKAYDIIVAMTNAGPGGASIMPAYFVIDAYWQKQNLGFASAGATVMLLTTLVLFLPLVIITAIRQRKAT